MYSGWGLPVDKSRPFAALSGDYSVDSMTHIVRNPDAWSLERCACGQGVQNLAGVVPAAIFMAGRELSSLSTYHRCLPVLPVF